MPKLTDKELDVIRKACLEKFKNFAQVFITHFGSFERYYPPFHDELCDFLQFAPTPDKLIILPRSTMKTTICSILYPLWKATKDPRVRWLLTGNSDKNAANNVTAIMGIVEQNPMYAALFSDRIPNFRQVRWSSEAAELNRPFKHPNATFEAAGVGTNTTGRHPTDIIEDDTVYPKKDQMTQQEMMPTRDDIEKAVGFHKLTLPLMDDTAKGERIFVCTRWAQYDAAHHIMENEVGGLGRYSVFDRPVRDPETQELNYPTFYDEDKLAMLKSSAGVGSFMYAMLFENNPLSSEFMKIRPEWIRYFHDNQSHDFVDAKTAEVLCSARDGRRMITVDAADPPGDRRAAQCFSVAVAATNVEAGLFVEKYVRGKWTDVELAKRTLDMSDELGITRIRIEADRYPHLVNTFRIEGQKRAGKRYSIEPVKTRGRRKDEDRIMQIAALAEDGLLYLRRNMNEMENEMYAFPNGTTNDLIDALAWHVLDDFRVPHKAKLPEEKKETLYNTFSMDQILQSMEINDSRYPIPYVAGIEEEQWADDKAPAIGRK
jgi:hypothetical protein